MNEMTRVEVLDVASDFAMSDEVGELFAALAKAQAADLTAGFNRKNPHFKNRYADLTAVWGVIRGPLSSHGLSVVQFPSARDKRVSVRTVLGHASGQWIACTTTATAEGETPQKIGSAITYLRRYGLTSMVGVVADEDDDGEAASSREAPEIRQAPPPPGTLREHAQSVQQRKPAAADAGAFPLIGPDGQEHTAASKDGVAAHMTWLAWFRKAVVSPRLNDAVALRSWFEANGHHIEAVRRAHPDTAKAADAALHARLAELDDSIPIPREPVREAAR